MFEFRSLTLLISVCSCRRPQTQKKHERSGEEEYRAQISLSLSEIKGERMLTVEKERKKWKEQATKFSQFFLSRGRIHTVTHLFGDC